MGEAGFEVGEGGFPLGVEAIGVEDGEPGGDVGEAGPGEEVGEGGVGGGGGGFEAGVEGDGVEAGGIGGGEVREGGKNVAHL